MGGIEYLHPPDDNMIWSDQLQVKLTGTGNGSWLYAQGTLSMQAPVLQITDDNAEKVEMSLSRGWQRSRRQDSWLFVTIDVPRRKRQLLKYFVIVGTFGPPSEIGSVAYVLMLNQRLDRKNTFERIGAGWIPAGMVRTGLISPSSSTIL